MKPAKRTQKTSCEGGGHVRAEAQKHGRPYWRVENRTNGVDICSKKEQLTNLLHDLCAGKRFRFISNVSGEHVTFVRHSNFSCFANDFRNVFRFFDG